MNRILRSMATAFATALVLCVFAAEASAQEGGGSEVYIRQASQEGSGDVLSGADGDDGRTEFGDVLSCSILGLAGGDCLPSGTAALRTAGGGNSATILQRGDRNVVDVTQRGIGNVVRASQSGQWNTLSSLQVGNENRLEVELLGSDNALDFEQIGNENEYVLQFLGDGLDHAFRQVGDRLRAVQRGVGTLPVGIEQFGRDMEILIEHDPVGVWPR